jgi:hypothetical protein
VTQQQPVQQLVQQQVQQPQHQPQVNINFYLLFSCLFYYASARAEKHNEIVSTSVLSVLL